jgi:hypothetical protein
LELNFIVHRRKGTRTIVKVLNRKETKCVKMEFSAGSSKIAMFSSSGLLAEGGGVSRRPLGEVQMMLASHVILHDAVVLEVHGADGALGGGGGAMLLAHMAPQAPRVVVAPTHPALHLTTLAAPCNTNTTQEIKISDYQNQRLNDLWKWRSRFMVTLQVSR